MQRSDRLRLSLVLLALTAGCSASGRRTDDLTPGELVTLGRYDEARELANAEFEEHPNDPEIAIRYQLVNTAWHLDQGRRAFETDQDLAALAHFRLAAQYSPEAQQPRAWILKLEEKLAEDALTRGLEALADDELELAAAEFEQALELRAGHERATELLAFTLLKINYREGLGADYYNDGVRELSDYRLYQADARFGYAKKYLGVEERVERRGHQVDGLLADQRIALARSLEAQGRWGAAKNEFRIALLVLPGQPEALEGFERCLVEAQAEQLLDEADLLILKGRFDDALAKIDAGAAITQLQADRFEGLRDAVVEARLEARYTRAVNLEKDFQYESAVRLYDELLDEVGYYGDAIARRDTLVSWIAKAEGLYEQAASEQDPEERLLLLREIELLWPEYRDVRELLLELDPPGSGGFGAGS